jgi:NAD+ synthase (glutamine-hydrolysing)
MSRIRFALAQLNPIVGDVTGNSLAILAAVSDAYGRGARVIVTPELSVTGYPVEDLASSSDFIRQSELGVAALAQRIAADGFGDAIVVVGCVERATTEEFGGARAHNSLAILSNGKVIATYAKRHLPTYSVFDEERIFVPGDGTLIMNLGGVATGFLICEDLWRNDGPVSELAEHDLDVVVVINASPFDTAKDDTRFPLLHTRALGFGAPVVYVNAVGGQDDLVFDGDSAVLDAEGTVLLRAPRFGPALELIDIAGTGFATDGIPLAEPTDSITPVVTPDLADIEATWNALVLGVRDYTLKNDFPSIVLGLSGGIDSAVCATIATDAIGADRVYGVSMPSQYSSDGSKDDARELATNLGCHYDTNSIAALVEPFERGLGLTGLAAENIQARARGMVLMSLSNQHGHLVLSTGNKSEVAVGYSTIYGDSVGGYAPIKDVFKTLVWDLARWRNSVAVERGETSPIPESSISKPPSAELRPDQTDQDSLPPYDVLDAILEHLVSNRDSIDTAVSHGFDRATVERVASLVTGAEWKRRQGAIGPRISRMAFGRERRLPITMRITPGLG